MSKTNDTARAHRALNDVIRQGLEVTNPIRVALQARYDRFASSKAYNDQPSELGNRYAA